MNFGEGCHGQNRLEALTYSTISVNCSSNSSAQFTIKHQYI